MAAAGGGSPSGTPVTSVSSSKGCETCTDRAWFPGPRQVPARRPKARLEGDRAAPGRSAEPVPPAPIRSSQPILESTHLRAGRRSHCLRLCTDGGPAERRHARRRRLRGGRRHPARRSDDSASGPGRRPPPSPGVLLRLRRRSTGARDWQRHGGGCLARRHGGRGCDVLRRRFRIGALLSNGVGPTGSLLAVADTQFIYVVPTVTRFSPVGQLAVVLLLTVLSAVQAAASARAHFARW